MRKNIAGQKIGAQMTTIADGSPFTGSVTVEVTGDAGTQATGSVGSGACTHEGNGYHTYAPAQAETNYDLIAFTFHGTGAITATVQVQTVDTILAAWFADPRSGYKGTGTAAGGDTDKITLATGAVAALGVKPGDFIVCVIDGVLDGQSVQSIVNDDCTMEGDWGPGTPDADDPYYTFAGSPGLPATVMADTFLARATAGGSNSAPTVSDDLSDAAAGGGAGGGSSSNVNAYTQ